MKHLPNCINIFAILLLWLLAGCTTIKYKDTGSEFEATSYFTFQRADKLVVTINGNKRTMELEGASSDQVQALEKVAGAVANAAINGMKP